MTSIDREQMRLALAEENRRQRENQLTIGMVVKAALAIGTMIAAMVIKYM